MTSASYIRSPLLYSQCVEECVRELEAVSMEYTAESPNFQSETSTHDHLGVSRDDTTLYDIL
jgi:hypothetical protein